jgi:1-acyl-sn-glycerol-3-phosphate acyltransferase
MPSALLSPSSRNGVTTAGLFMTSPSGFAETKRALLLQLAKFLADHTPAQVAELRARIEVLIAQAPEPELLRLAERIANTGNDWGYFPSEPIARHFGHALADVTLTEDSELANKERLEPIRNRPLVLLPNHISYSDANLIEMLLHRFGFADIAERMTVIAGPKVYSDALRRFMSLCFGTIKTAQSAALSSGEAVMPPREVARIARITIDNALAELDRGQTLVLFSEGTRSRSAALQPVLAAAARYLDHEQSVLVPIGITGAERIFGVGDSSLHPARVVIHVGEPIEARAFVQKHDAKRPAMAEAIGRAIAATLPAEYRGVYA